MRTETMVSEEWGQVYMLTYPSTHSAVHINQCATLSSRWSIAVAVWVWRAYTCSGEGREDLIYADSRWKLILSDTDWHHTEPFFGVSLWFWRPLWIFWKLTLLLQERFAELWLEWNCTKSVRCNFVYRPTLCSCDLGDCWAVCCVSLRYRLTLYDTVG